MSNRFWTRKRVNHWMTGVLLWVLIVLFYSTRTNPPGHESSWVESLKITAGLWFIWGVLAAAIICVDRWLPVSRDALLRRFLCHIPLCLAFTTLNIYVTEAIRLWLTSQITHFSLSFSVLRYSWYGLFHINIIIYWAIVGVYIAYDYNIRLKERQLQTAELERMLSEARLDTLRTQLHPHFLFNALNTVSAQIDRDPRTARRMLERLAELLRLSLDHAEDPEIALAQEMDFIERYLELQKARFEERLEVKIRVSTETREAMVPTFLLEPLVENAIRHGISQRSEGGVVEIQARQEQGRLRISITDNGPGLPGDWDPERDVGIGIANTRERLRCMYGEDPRLFQIHSSPGTGVCVEIDIPYQHMDDVN